jgi:hypothetical protein
VTALLNKDAPCAYGNTCSFNGMYQPPLIPAKFYLSDHYGAVINVLYNTTDATPFTPLELKATAEKLCGEPWV